MTLAARIIKWFCVAPRAMFNVARQQWHETASAASGPPALVRHSDDVLQAWCFAEAPLGWSVFMAIPDWIADERIAPGLNFPGLIVRTKAGPTEVNRGDWILRYPDGELIVCRKYQFDRRFRAAK